MSNTVTALDGVLKNFYTDAYITNIQGEASPFFRKMQKNTNGSGKKNIFPVVYGTDEGISADLASAQAIAATTNGSTKTDDWVCDWGDYDGIVTRISHKLIKASASDMGCFIEAQKTIIDGMFRRFFEVMARYCLHSKSRNLGAGTCTSGVITLTNLSDVIHYSKGMQIVCSANDGSSTGHALRTGTGYVIAVNPNAGTVTVSATDGGSAGDPDASWGSGATSYFFRLGDFGGTSSPKTVVMGYADWCPSSDPSATAFNGVDRTANIAALSGIRLTATEINGLSIEARIKKLCTKMFNRYGAPKEVWMDPENWLALANEQEAKGVRDLTGKDAVFGYETLRVATPGGIVPVYADRFVPYGSIYALDPKAFQLDSIDKVPHYLDKDGNMMRLLSSTNEYEIRLCAYPCTRATPSLMGQTSCP